MSFCHPCTLSLFKKIRFCTHLRDGTKENSFSLAWITSYNDRTRKKWLYLTDVTRIFLPSVLFISRTVFTCYILFNTIWWLINVFVNKSLITSDWFSCWFLVISTNIADTKVNILLCEVKALRFLKSRLLQSSMNFYILVKKLFYLILRNLDIVDLIQYWYLIGLLIISR